MAIKTIQEAIENRLATIIINDDIHRGGQRVVKNTICAYGMINSKVMFVALSNGKSFQFRYEEEELAEKVLEQIDHFINNTDIGVLYDQ